VDCEDLDHELRKAITQKRPLPEFAREASAFVRQALESELRAIRASSGPVAPPVRLLISMCGTSPPPVLLSAHHLAPEELVLVGSATEEGRVAVEDVRAYAPASCRECHLVEIDGSDPMRAFGQLRELVSPIVERHDRGSIALDITGGKKTMVAAGFLLATELGLRIFYVDGEYVPEARIPRPCTAQLLELRDPVAGFRLREERRARALYEQGRFRAAEELFGEAADALSALALDERAAELRRSATLARWAEAWEGARYDDPDAESALPEPVGRLADAWRALAGQPDRLEALVKRERSAVLRFAADRLGWALFRYRQGDARAGLIDAYSACEVATDALLMALLSDGRWTVHMSGEPVRTPRALKKRGLRPEAERALKDGGAHEGERLEVKAGVPGVGDVMAEVFSGEIGEHRNGLIHGIEQVRPEIASKLLDGSPCLATRLLQRVAKVMAHRDADVELVDAVLAVERPPARPQAGRSS